MPAARPEVPDSENWLIVGWLAAASTVSVNSWVWTMPPASIAATSMTAVPLAWAAALTVIRRLPSMSLGPNDHQLLFELSITGAPAMVASG